MTDKTIFADNHESVLVGREAILKSHQNFFSQMKPDLSTPVEDVRVVGDLAVARGTYANNVTPKAQGLAPIIYTGSWTVTFARQSDGSWKWDWCVANSNQPAPGSTASGADEQTLYQIGRDKTAAYAKKDAEVAEKFLANEFVSNIDGRTENKKQFLARIKTNPATIESAANSEMKAMMFGDTAVVHGLWIEKSTTSGKDTSYQARFTEVYVKRDGRWQCVTQYATKVQ